MKESICFDCKNAYAHKCTWVGFGKAVEGFKFDTVKYSGSDEKIAVVRSCPSFESDRKRQNISARNKKILELAEREDMTVRKIAAKVGCSDFTVQRVITNLGEKNRKRKCAVCGKEFKLCGNTRFCSRECRERAGYKRGKKKEKKGRLFTGRETNGLDTVATERAAAK